MLASNMLKDHQKKERKLQEKCLFRKGVVRDERWINCPGELGEIFDAYQRRAFVGTSSPYLRYPSADLVH